jgi:hypothetical protein
MPLTRANVLDLLSGPIIMSIDFWVGRVHVSGIGYRVVRDNILVKTIQVVPGT